MNSSWFRRTLPGVLVLSVTMIWSISAWSAVEEIIVTVSKKAESLQDVPMSVTAFSADDIARKGIKDIGDVARFSTSIQFDESFAQSDTRIVVRGLSPTRGRQNVALLVDGVDVSSEAITSSGGSLLLNTRLVDIERIEVVLGPQMALYGRSAFNGAIKYITKDASEEFETNVSLDGGFSGDSGVRNYEAIVGASGPIFGEALGFRVNGAWWEDEGFHRNQLTGQRVGGEKGYGLALTLNSNIGESLGLKFRAEFTDDEGQPSAQAFLPFNAELDIPQGAFDAGAIPGLVDSGGVAECFPDFVAAVAAVPGNNQAYLDRALRILDPAFVATLDPDTLDPNSPNFRIPGGGPYCERTTIKRVGNVPDGDELAVNAATNPVTPGQDYEGFDRELLRLSLVTSFDAESWSLKWLNGYTREDNIEQQDSGAFGFRSAAAGEFIDGNVNSFSFNNAKITEQISTDLYVTTSFDGPVNGTLGGLYWLEKVDNRSRSITTQASGSHCFWNSALGLLNPIGIDDGCTGYTDTPYAPYQAAADPFRSASPADRDTEHFSVYGQLDFQLAENVTLSFEGRYNDEDVDVSGPIFYIPNASGGPGGLNPCGIFFRGCEPFEDWRAAGNWFSDSFFPWTDEAPDGNDLGRWVPDQALLDGIDQKCLQQDPAGVARSIADGPILIERNPDGSPVWDAGSVVPILDANGRAQGIDANGNAVPLESARAVGTDTFNPWCLDQLTDSDSWFSPKVRLEWAATDDMLLYATWARARKPGGFSLLTVGSSGLDRELAEFEPEKMVVWEVGANTSWFENSLVVNGAVFFQDFTDKQALTTQLNAAGDRLVSKIVNAGKAEVWGSEISIDWSPSAEFLGGNWRTNLGWTWLPTREYTDFTVDSSSPASAAVAGNCTVTTRFLCSLSYTGNKLEDSAEHAVSGSVQYMFPLTGSVNTFVETDVLYQTERYAGITNTLIVDSFLEFNLRAGFESERWELVMYVNNLLNDDTVRFTGGGPGLGCCFALGSSIDLTPQAHPNDQSPNPELIAEPRSAVMVDLPLFNTAFLPDPRVIGLRFTARFGGG